MRSVFGSKAIKELARGVKEAMTKIAQRGK
jgi:hypothetical protein